MNSLVVLFACLAAASASYAGAYHGSYGWAGHGYPYAYSGHGYAGLGYAGHGYAGHGYAGHGYAGHGYHGPIAIPHVLPSGYLADTPEVAAAKGAHLTAVAAASHRSGSYGHGYGYGNGYGYGHGYGHGSYHGPLAVPHVLPSGYLADTPDVAAVKAAHLTAVAAQGGATHNYAHGYGHAYPYYGHGFYHH